MFATIFLNWLGVIDILLVTLIFFGLLYLLRDAQAMVLLRGVILLGGNDFGV